MGLVNPTMPTLGDPRGTEEVDLQNAVQALLNAFNGNIEAVNIADGTITAAELATALAQSYLALIGTQNLAMQRGRKNIQLSNVLNGGNVDATVAHTLGRTPLGVFLTVRETASSGAGPTAMYLANGGNAPDSDSFVIRLWNYTGATLNVFVDVDWLIIG
jgi:hypothetical protein